MERMSAERDPPTGKDDRPRQTRLEIQKLNELPAMSLVVRQFLAAVQDPDLEVRQMAQIVEQDPGLLGRLIGVANSAYFGYPEPVVTAEDAIFKVLGLNMARNLALGIVLSGPFDASRCPGFALDRYWAHAMTVALLAQRLAPFVTITPRPSPGDAYLAGLLHSIGLLALVHLFPRAMNEVFRARPADADALLALEREIVGADHCDVGGWLARKWRLPRHIVAVVERHMESGHKGEHHVLASLIRHAVRWAEAQDGGADAPPPDMSDCGLDAAAVQQSTAEIGARREQIRQLSRVLAHG